MKTDNVLMSANTNTDTSSDLKLSFTIEHMALLLMVYEGVRQLEDSLMQIAGDYDSTVPETSLWKLTMTDTLLAKLSPLYSSITPSGKKMSELDWKDADNLYTCILDNIGGQYEKSARYLMCSSPIDMNDQSNIVDSVPFTKDHMIILLTIYDGMQQIKDEISEVINCFTDGEKGSALWKISSLYGLVNSLSPLYETRLPSGKIISELDWEDPENIYALALDDTGGELEKRARILMGDIG